MELHIDSDSASAQQHPTCCRRFFIIARMLLILMLFLFSCCCCCCCTHAFNMKQSAAFVVLFLLLYNKKKYKNITRGIFKLNVGIEMCATCNMPLATELQQFSIKLSAIDPRKMVNSIATSSAAHDNSLIPCHLSSSRTR